MPLRMELRSRTGKVLAVTGETYDTVDSMLPEVEFSTFPLLAGVDRYEDTMFNRIQLAPLAVELQRLLADAPLARSKMVKRLIELCHEGSKVPDVQLWFIAD